MLKVRASEFYQPYIYRTGVGRSREDSTCQDKAVRNGRTHLCMRRSSILLPVYFPILAIVLATVALWRIKQTGLGTEYRMRAIIAILIAILALIIILIPTLNPDMRMKWPT